MNKSFKKLAFWKLFTVLEQPELEVKTIEEWIDWLSVDYRINKENFIYQHEGQSFEATNQVVVFDFNCGAEFDLQLEFTPHPEGSEKYLYLFNKKSQEKQLMGWWDLARWHPHCLQEQELWQLMEYWEKNDPKWANKDLALVLLHDFVGFANVEAADDFSLEVFKAYQRLEIKGFSKMAQKPIAVFVYEDCAYEWKSDPTLGPVFESTVYGCYSIRNKSHEHSEEGRFPFKDWNRLLKSL